MNITLVRQRTKNPFVIYRGYPSVSMWWEGSWVYTSQMLVKMRPGGFDYVLLCHLQHCFRVWILCTSICWCFVGAWGSWFCGVISFSLNFLDSINTEGGVPKLGMCFSKFVPGFWLYTKPLSYKIKGQRLELVLLCNNQQSASYTQHYRSVCPSCISDQTVSDERVIDDGVDRGFDLVQASLGQQSPSWFWDP